MAAMDFRRWWKKNAFQAATEVYNDRNKVVAILGAILYFSKILDFH